MKIRTDASTEVPSLSGVGLAKATGIALLIAIVLLVFVVLPAEYDIDPSGFGQAIGLTRLVSAEEDKKVEKPHDQATVNTRNDRVEIEVPPGKSVEYKLFLRAGQKMKYSWEDAEVVLFYDFHGEPEGDTTGFFESYVASTSQMAKGTFTAPFDGAHGWYWKNSSAQAAKITLDISGSYEVLGLR